MLNSNKYIIEGSPSQDARHHMFSICLVRQVQEIKISLGNTVIVICIVASLVIVVISILTYLCIFQTSHILIRPLRKLNTKMLEVMVDEVKTGMQAQELKAEEDSSFEISALYSIFKDLIQDKQFS